MKHSVDSISPLQCQQNANIDVVLKAKKIVIHAVYMRTGLLGPAGTPVVRYLIGNYLQVFKIFIKNTSFLCV